MAIVKAENVVNQARGFNRLPMLRQMGLMIGLAASVAIGVALSQWFMEPSYSLLYGGLSNKDASEIVQVLQKSNIPYQLEQGTGAVLVAGSQVHEARLKLAEQGLPRGDGSGFEMLEKEQGFGTSQFIETARYQHALEGELARTIGTMGSVQEARVHLALPKQTVFVRDRQKPSASVMLSLYAGRTLDEGQVAAIVHMVASSVPHLEAANVTVVDQQGRLLTSGNDSRELALSDSQFKYTRRLEETYGQRIEDLLSPLIGAGGVRAQVVADVDFTYTEQTREKFEPDQTVVRSEQTAETVTAGPGGMASGVPGALSNVPPGAGTTNPAATAAPGTAPAAPPLNTSKQATRNYELDKTISHTRNPLGSVRRLSVAVVLDNVMVTNDEGDSERKPISEEDLTRYTNLVKEAVGFDEARGDTVNVINAPFQAVPEIEPAPAQPIWEQAWVWDVARKLGVGVLILMLILGVVRPTMKSLAEKGIEAPRGEMALAGPDGMAGEDRLSLTGHQQGQLPPPQNMQYESHLNTARTMVQQDPKRVAQVVKNWVGDDG